MGPARMRESLTTTPGIRKHIKSTSVTLRHYAEGCPYRGENHGPGKDARRNLTPMPELENNQDPQTTLGQLLNPPSSCAKGCLQVLCAKPLVEAMERSTF